MATATRVQVEINGGRDHAQEPILWRLARMFDVTTNVRKARVSEDRARMLVEIEGDPDQVDGTVNWLRSLGVCEGTAEPAPVPAVREPETPYSIRVGLSAAAPDQAAMPSLCRAGRDFEVVINIVRASYDDETGGTLTVDVAGPLQQVQRAIAWLHTTGLHVDPEQRSVTDGSNL